MADVVITLNIMPESPDINLDEVKGKALEIITNFSGNDNTKVEIEPVAFGLKALKIMFVSDEDKGSTEDIEADIEKIDGVNSVEVTDVRRTLG